MRTLSRYAVLVSCAAVLSFSGCGEGLPDRHPVEGQVTHQGQPLSEATVLFHPLGEAPQGLAQPMALTGPDGKFRLTTAEANDGATAGEYAITVTQPALILVGEEETRNGPNTLPPTYAEPETTPLKYTVVEGPNVVPPIELK